MATLKVLEHFGATVEFPVEQTCCGQPAFNSGYWKETAAFAEKFLTDFDADMPVVSPSGSCSGFIIHHYHKVLKDRPELMEKYNKIKKKCELLIYNSRDMIMDKITKLLAKIKSGSLTGLDENLIRSEILKKIKVTTLYPYPPIAKAIKDFIISLIAFLFNPLILKN